MAGVESKNSFLELPDCLKEQVMTFLNEHDQASLFFLNESECRSQSSPGPWKSAVSHNRLVKVEKELAAWQKHWKWDESSLANRLLAMPRDASDQARLVALRETCVTWLGAADFSIEDGLIGFRASFLRNNREPLGSLDYFGIVPTNRIQPYLKRLLSWSKTLYGEDDMVTLAKARLALKIHLQSLEAMLRMSKIIDDRWNHNHFIEIEVDLHQLPFTKAMVEKSLGGGAQIKYISSPQNTLPPADNQSSVNFYRNHGVLSSHWPPESPVLSMPEYLQLIAAPPSPASDEALIHSLSHADEQTFFNLWQQRKLRDRMSWDKCLQLVDSNSAAVFGDPKESSLLSLPFLQLFVSDPRRFLSVEYRFDAQLKRVLSPWRSEALIRAAVPPAYRIDHLGEEACTADNIALLFLRCNQAQLIDLMGRYFLLASILPEYISPEKRFLHPKFKLTVGVLCCDFFSRFSPYNFSYNRGRIKRQLNNKGYLDFLDAEHKEFRTLSELDDSAFENNRKFPPFSMEREIKSHEPSRPIITWANRFSEKVLFLCFMAATMFYAAICSIMIVILFLNRVTTVVGLQGVYVYAMLFFTLTILLFILYLLIMVNIEVKDKPAARWKLWHFKCHGCGNYGILNAMAVLLALGTIFPALTLTTISISLWTATSLGGWTAGLTVTMAPLVLAVSVSAWLGFFAVLWFRHDCAKLYWPAPTPAPTPAPIFFFETAEAFTRKVSDEEKKSQPSPTPKILNACATAFKN